MLEWNVFINDVNHREIRTFNVFDHYGFLEDCADNAKKNNKDFAAFADQLNRDAMYYFWSKCEWEIIISDWPTTGKCEEKIDVYDQLLMNWEHFSNYVWSHGVELRRWRKLQKAEAKELAKKVDMSKQKRWSHEVGGAISIDGQVKGAFDADSSRT